MAKQKHSAGRRGFLKGAGAGAAAAGLGIVPQVARAQGAVESVKPGSDFMVEVFQSLGFEYCGANAGSAFRGLHECTSTWTKPTPILWAIR